MTTFKAKVLQDIPANRLIGLGGVNRADDPDEGWNTVLLIQSELGWTPDLVSTKDLKEGDEVTVTIKDSPTWKVESSQDLPAGTLVQCDSDGRVKSYSVNDGNHVGFTTHAVKEGEVVSIVRKYGRLVDSQLESSSNGGEVQRTTKKTTKKKES